MPTDKTWSMHCVLAGVRVARMVKEGREAEARKYLMNLTLEFTPEVINYLLLRIKSGS